MKKIVTFLFLLPLALCAGISLFDGKETVPVVVPSVQTPAQKTATAELTEYLAKITGKQFQVVQEGSSSPTSAIYLGNTDFALKQGLDFGKFGDEEWIIKSYGSHLVIAGGEPRGTLYGVYHFLEDVLGVHWLTPSVEYVPEKTKIELEELNLSGRPPMLYRDVYLVPGISGRIFLARNRMNTSDSNYGGRMLFSRLSGREAQGSAHTMYTVLGDADCLRKLFKEHPEYFPLIDGVRTFDSVRANGAAQSQFCLTSLGLRKLWVEALRGHIRHDREFAGKRGIQPPMFYAIDQNDCYDGFCTCPSCDAVVKREGSKSGLMLDFVNHVADQLKEEAPDAVFLMMAIHSTEPPPKFMKALPNVGIRLCDTTSNILRPWSDPANAGHRKNLEGWAKICNNIVMWDYSITYGSPVCINYPTPTLRTFAPDLRMLAANHGGGVFFEHEQVIGADMRDLKVWIEIKLAENPGLDYDTLLKTFTDLYYGPAGGKIREYLDLLERASEKGGANISWFPALSAYNFIDAETMSRASRILDEAERMVAKEPELVRRVEHARLSLDRLYLIRSGAYRKSLDMAGRKDVVLPDYAKTAERYQRVWNHEMDAREVDRNNKFYISEYENNVTKFLDMAAKRKELPVPEQFKRVEPDALYLFGTGLAQIYIDYLKLVKDPESPAGEALCAKMSDIVKTLHKDFREDKYQYPFSWTVWPSMAGTIRGKIQNFPEAMPKGYHWYKLGEGIKLTQTSVVSMFAGFLIALDGVVSDNSELGQKYEIWVSIKVLGPDFYRMGKPGLENVFYIDQFAVVRQTRNMQGTSE